MLLVKLEGEGGSLGYSSQLKQLIVEMVQLEQLLNCKGLEIVKQEGERLNET